MKFSFSLLFLRNKCLRLLNCAGLRKRKVFVIGYNKSATTSIHHLFLHLGFNSYHSARWRSCDPKLLKPFDCLGDGPPDDLELIDATYPKSKFILQVRDLGEWLYSRLSHIEREKALGQPNVGGGMGYY